jgi:NAD(P)H-hydrate epimerase
MPGAPHLSGLAALRTGSGLVRIALDQATKAVVSPVHYELTYHTYDTPNELLDKLKKTSSIIYGIGMGEIDNQEAFLTALIHKKIPIVIDGDGLKVLKKIIWDFPNSLEHVIIMPHVGEMARLLDQTSKEILNDPLKAVTSLTSKTNMTIALKGPATIIANRDNVTFIQAKNPGLATAGSGDTLAGITASLLGRHMVPFDALRLSVVLHSKAGLYASKALGEESLIASDIITYLPHAFKDIKKH